MSHNHFNPTPPTTMTEESTNKVVQEIGKKTAHQTAPYVHQLVESAKKGQHLIWMIQKREKLLTPPN